jgi:hypothetical protein
MTGRRWRWSPPVTKLVLGFLLLALLAFGSALYGATTSHSRVAPSLVALSARQPRFSVLISLNFKPVSFHLKYLQNYGSLGHINGDAVELRNVTAAGLTALGRTPWISQISLDPAA